LIVCVLSGAPHGVYDKIQFRCDPNVFSLGIPVLGICYGMQLMAIHFDGEVEKNSERKYDKAQIELTTEGGLLKDTAKDQSVWMSYGDRVIQAPASFEVDGTSELIPVDAMSDKRKKLRSEERRVGEYSK